MKKLSIEDKAKRYDEAYKKVAIRFGSNVADEIFPELKESEDERIRKDIITTLSIGVSCNESALHPGARTTLKEAVAWLEKQGEQKLADKVELKFKVGDWIVCNNGSHPIFQVIERSWPNAKYRNINGSEIFLNVNTLDKQYHLWTIQDAKDGDVLSYRGGQWIFIYKEKIDDKSFSYYTLYSTVYQDLKLNDSGFTLLIDAVVPATKEQRDLLFQKMKEVGYEWDADKKELKNIEQKQVITYPDNLPKDNWELIHEFVNKFGRIPKDEDELNVLIEYVLKRQKAALSEEDERFADKMVCVMKSEQKSADSIVPKFKVGDWIVFNGLVLFIKEVVQGYYRTIARDGVPNSYDWDTDNAARLWTIQDAKDGDVLATNSWLYIFKYTNNKALIQFHCNCPINGKPYKWSFLSDDSYLDIYKDDIKPATKEQRELLFQKIKEAGYEWDADKKELKKIELNTAWGEEDEEMLNLIIARLHSHPNVELEEYGKSHDWLKSLKDKVFTQPKQEWSEEDEESILEICNYLDRIVREDEDNKATQSCVQELKEWLKSLRLQNKWKPSDEQMEALESATENCAYSEYQDCLRELIWQLKKLK